MTESSTAHDKRPVPAVFAFELAQPHLQGPAFSPVFKALAWGISAGLLAWMLRLQLPWGQGATVWAWAAWVLITYTAWTVQRSQLHIRTGWIEQDWIWRRQMAIADLAYLKLIRVRGLEWLMAPRVYARTMQGSFVVFYCADAAVLAELARMTAELNQWREKIIRGH